MASKTRKTVSLDDFTVNGQHLTDDIISDMVAQGPTTLRKRGRPARQGNRASTGVTVKFSEAEIRWIDQGAKEQQMNRSDFIRKILSANIPEITEHAVSSPA